MLSGCEVRYNDSGDGKLFALVRESMAAAPAAWTTTASWLHSLKQFSFPTNDVVSRITAVPFITAALVNTPGPRAKQERQPSNVFCLHTDDRFANVTGMPLGGAVHVAGLNVAAPRSRDLALFPTFNVPYVNCA